mmetsp:Transcript_27430/g.58671  ORF Transcript_27430/g.58671 Transcript_27430/m.58671 type:complete len:620 (-) Transcript_27430:189-2048(-)
MSSLRQALKLSIEESHHPRNRAGCSDIESSSSENKRCNASDNCKAKAKCNHDGDVSEHDEIVCEPTDDDMDSEDELGAFIYKTSLAAKSLAATALSLSTTEEADAASLPTTDEKVLNRRTPPRHLNSSVPTITRESNPLQRLRNTIGCRKCQKEVGCGEETREMHDGRCPRKWQSAGGSYKTKGKKCASLEHHEDRREHKATPSSKQSIRDKCNTTKGTSIQGAGDDFHDHTTRRSMRKRSAPDHFVARPSKSGVGVKDGDDEFLAATNSAAISASDGTITGEVTRDNVMVSLAKERTRKDHGYKCPRKRRKKEESEDKNDGEVEIQESDRSHKKAMKWTLEEDMELVKRVRLHGDGNWKGILDNSPILQERYITAPSVGHARRSLRMRWPFTLKKMKARNDDDFSDRTHDNESVASFTNPDRSDESMGSETESGEEEDSQDTHRYSGSERGWSTEEEEELRKRVHLHGEGNWKDILNNSDILQDRYKTASSAKIARQCIFLRWRRKHMENWNDDDHSDGVQDNSDESIESESESGDEEDSQDTHSHSQKKWPSQYSTEENEELRKRVRLHGEGNWKVILDNSPILQERYKSTVSAKSARQSIANIWGKYHKKNCRMHK